MSLSKEVVESLDCPICRDVPRDGHIWQCDNGHLLCTMCRKKVTSCPMCKIGLRNVRSLIAEKFVRQIPLACKFEADGCQEILPFDQRLQHDKICLFRRVQCPNYGYCSEQISLAKLADHTSKTHKFKIGFGVYRACVNAAIQFDDPSNKRHYFWQPCQEQYDGKIFYCMMMQDNSIGMWFLWVFIAGTPDEAKAYKFEINLKNEDGDSIMYKLPVTSIDTQVAEVIKSGSVCSIKNSGIKSFCRNEMLEVEYKVMSTIP